MVDHKNSMDSKERILDFTEKLSNKENSQEQERNNRIINSSVAYLAAFAIVYVSFYVISSLFAKRFSLLYKLYFFKVDYTYSW